MGWCLLWRNINVLKECHTPVCEIRVLFRWARIFGASPTAIVSVEAMEAAQYAIDIISKFLCAYWVISISTVIAAERRLMGVLCRVVAVVSRIIKTANHFSKYRWVIDITRCMSLLKHVEIQWSYLCEIANKWYRERVSCMKRAITGVAQMMSKARPNWKWKAV